MKKRNKILLTITFVLCLVFCSVFAGCNDTQTDDKSFTITNKISTLEKDESHSFLTQIVGVSGIVTWSSSDTSILSVTDGTVTALKVGSATVTATIENLSDSVTITVTDIKRPYLETNENETVKIYQGLTYKAQPNVMYDGKVVEGVTFTYSINQTDVISIAPDGTVSALQVGVGTVYITSSYRGHTVTGSYDIEVIEGTFVSLDKSQVDLSTMIIEDKSTVATVKATIMKNGILDEEDLVNWSVEDATVATVSNGVITAVDEGSTIVKATFDFGGKQYVARCNVNVSKPVFDTGLSFEYVMTDTLKLPEYNVSDFCTENVISVISNGVDVYAGNGKLDRTLFAGSEIAKSVTIITRGAKYEVLMQAINAKITTKDQLKNVNDLLSKFEVNDNGNEEGYYYDGYVVLESDIVYNDSFKGIANIDDCKPASVIGTWWDYVLAQNNFRGVFDGNGHTISGIKFDSNGASFINILYENAVIKNVKFNDVEVSARSSAIVSTLMNKGRIENVEVKGVFGELVSPIANTNYTRGFVVAHVFGKECVIKDVVAILEQPLAEYDKTALFGFFHFNYGAPVFNNVTIVGSDVLYGYSHDEQASSYQEFLLQQSASSVIIYATVEEYIQHLGYTLNQEKTVEETCTIDGVTVYSKNGLPDYVIVKKAEGHNFVTVGGKTECENCHKERITVNVEFDVLHGLNFASLYEESEIYNITYEDKALIHTNGLVVVSNETASLVAKEYVINYVDGTIVVANVTVYSALIYNEEDLRKANTTEVLTNEGYGNNSVAYFKLMDDIILTQDWTATQQIGANTHVSPKAAFLGVFDGNNKSITGMNIPNASACGLIKNIGVGAVVKNITITGKVLCSSMNGGLLAAYTTGGTIENITLNVTGMATAGSDTAVASGALLGGIFGGNTNYQPDTNNLFITVKNCVIINQGGDYAKASALGNNYIASGKYSPHITFENVAVVGFKVILRDGTNNVEDANGLTSLGITGVSVYEDVNSYESTKS